MNARTPIHAGLEGVTVAATRLSCVEGEVGRLTLVGYAVEEVAPALEFEAMVWLLWRGELASAEQLRGFAGELAEARVLEPATLALLEVAAARAVSPGEALRMAAASLALGPLDAVRVVAALPTIVAAYERLRRGLEPLAPNPELSLAADFLRMVRGASPRLAGARALTTYLNTVIDHGFNASTFSARIVASTGASIGAALVAGLAALSGPLHGGAPGPALEALLALRERDGDLDQNTRAWVEAELAAGRRIMGFGHRVYRARDPRADVLGAAARELLAGTGLYEDARIHEQAVLETLAAHKPGRTLETNVEFYTALLLHGLGLEPSVFTSVFAMARAAGWMAHYDEERATGRLIRPRARYEGPRGLSIGGLTTNLVRPI